MFTKVLVATNLSEASERVIGALNSLKTLETREAVLSTYENACSALSEKSVGKRTCPSGLQVGVSRTARPFSSFSLSHGFSTGRVALWMTALI